MTDQPEQIERPEQTGHTERPEQAGPDLVAEFRGLLTADAVDPAQLQSRVRRGGALARAAVIALAQDGSAPQRLSFRAAVLAADACADDSHLRRALDAAAADPAAPTLSEVLAAVDDTARPGGPAATLLDDAAVTADLLTAGIAARPEDGRIAAAVLESLGDSSGFTLVVRPVRSRENAVKVLRNGMALLARATDDRVVHALEQVLLARVTSAASPMNDEILRAVLASPSGRGPDLVADLARAGVPGIRRQAQSALGMEVEPASDDAGETAMVMVAISERNRPSEPDPAPAAAAVPARASAQAPTPAADPVPTTTVAAAVAPVAPAAVMRAPDLEPGALPSPRPFRPPGADAEAAGPEPARKRSWFARLFGLGRR